MAAVDYLGISDRYSLLAVQYTLLFVSRSDTAYICLRSSYCLLMPLLKPLLAWEREDLIVDEQVLADALVLPVTYAVFAW